MTQFFGCGTALVTPFSKNGLVDERTLRALVGRQIRAGIDFLVPCGTTGESPTLSHEEHHEVIRIVIEEANGRVPIMAGTGSNCTQEAIELTRFAKKAGADGCLVVAPYYNKPTQKGLEEYYGAIAEVGLPVVVYNIPGRTGVNILPETLAKIADNPNIIGVKEATGSLEQMAQDITLCGKRIVYFSGDDALTLPLISIGGCGAISVISNLLPSETREMIHDALNGNLKRASEEYYRLFPLCKAMFLETNPIPIKTAMAMLNLLEPVWRSPMTAPEKRTVLAIRSEMEKFGLEIQKPIIFPD